MSEECTPHVPVQNDDGSWQVIRHVIPATETTPETYDTEAVCSKCGIDITVTEESPVWIPA